MSQPDLPDAKEPTLAESKRLRQMSDVLAAQSAALSKKVAKLAQKQIEIDTRIRLWNG